MIKRIISILFLLNAIAANCIELDIESTTEKVSSFVERALKVGSMGYGKSEIYFNGEDMSNSIDCFIIGMEIMSPAIFKKDDTKVINQAQAIGVKLWCQENVKYLTWGLFEDIMDYAEYYGYNNGIDIEDVERLRQRLETRRGTQCLEYDKEAEQYILDRISPIQKLFSDNHAGLIESVRLTQLYQSLVYALSVYSGNMYFNEQNGIITRRQFEDMKDWCYLNLNKIDIKRVKNYESDFILKDF